MQKHHQTFKSVFRDISPSRKTALFLCACFVFVAASYCFATERFFANADSEYPSGLFCLRSGTETNTQIRLFKFDNGKIDLLFARAIEGGIEPPICFSNSVVTVNSRRVIRKFSLDGELLFEAAPKGITGACGESGRLGGRHIFMTETISESQTRILSYRLHIVDISDSIPEIKASFVIVQPLQISHTADEVIVIGQTNIVRIKIPEQLK